MKCVKWKVLEKLRDKKIYTFYRTLKKGEIYPPPPFHANISYITQTVFAVITEAKSGYLDSDFRLPEFFL